MANFKLNLYENSVSFFEESLKKAISAETNPIEWKFALLSLIQSIELSIKQRLRIEHEFLIYSNIDNPKTSVSIEVGIKRLEGICKIKLSKHELQSINLAKNWRNLITHFEFEFNEQQVKSTFAILLGFMFEFNRNYLEKDLYNILPANLLKEVIQVESYFEELGKKASKRIKEEGILPKDIMVCKQCRTTSFVLKYFPVNQFIGSCYLCGLGEEMSYCEICTGLFFWDDLEIVKTSSSSGDNYIHVCKDYCAAKFTIEERINY